MKFDVVTFGSAVVDAFVDTDVSEEKGFMQYKVGDKMLIKSLKFEIGGGGTNTAVAFSRLGLKTGYIGEFGEDVNGKRILDLLKNERIEFLGKIVRGELTGYSVILDSKDHDRTILTYKGANDEISPRDIKKFESKWMYYSSLLGKSFETQKEIAKEFVKNGGRIAFNPSSYLIKNKNLSSLLKLTHILILNKEEAAMLTREKDLLVGLHRLGPKIVVITDRDKMISCYDGNEKYFLKPHQNLKVVERTGAGDAFASGFVAGQIVGKTIEESLKLGLAEGESVITSRGAKNKLLRMKLRK